VNVTEAEEIVKHGACTTTKYSEGAGICEMKLKRGATRENYVNISYEGHAASIEIFVPHMLWRFIKSKVYSYSTKFVD
jgi:hypothetical protein